jgi:uncharacterized protein YndB with AHSA1/START domain
MGTQQAEITARIDVEASVERVWAAVVDWDTQHEWMFLTRVRGTHQQGQGVGGRLEAFTGIGPLGFLDTMEITEWDPPRRCVVLHTGRVVRGTAAFVVEPRGDNAATFVWAEWLDLPLGRLGLAAWPAVRPLIALPLAYSLRKLKRRIERG